MKLLFFDDEKNLYDSVWKDFSFCWTRTYPQIVIEHQSDKDYFDDYRAVRDVISSSIDQYQIFFVDLLVPSDEQNSAESKIASGLDLIDLAKQNPKCIIVAITSTAIKKYPTLKEDAFKAGADLVIVRTEFDSGMTRYRKLCDEIYEKCVGKHIVKDEISLEKEDNPKLDFIISQIGGNDSQKGENNIRYLYKKALPSVTNMSKMKVEYLAPGMSGAFVLKMCAFEKGQPTATHLLKINQDNEMLKKEIENCPLSGRYNKGLFINYLQTKDNLKHLPNVGRWFAICAVFENNSLTLRDWLNESRGDHEISEVLKTIFYREREGLAVGYSDLISNSYIIGNGLNLTASRLPRIIMSLEELKEIWAHPELGNDSQVKNKYAEIEDFLLKKGEFWGETNLSFAPCHGDFHTRNILIDIAGFPKPTIIDTAEFSHYHWSTDYVRLIVDLILTSYDFGVESQLWKHLPKWISISESIITSQVINDPNNDNKSVRFAINWLIENFSKIFFFINSEADFKQLQWELQLSLAIEFLRAAYRTDLSTPKRVLALQSGHFALIEASKSFKFKK